MKLDMFQKGKKKALHVNKTLSHLELKHYFYFCYFSVLFLPVSEIKLMFR